MAKLVNDRISEVRFVIIPGERTFDSPTVHPKLREMYEKMGYPDSPKAAYEAITRGSPEYNGLVGSCVSIRTYGDIVAVDFMATRFFLGKAVRDLAKEIGSEAAGKCSPNIANVGLLVPTMFRKEPVIIGQVKKKATGMGQIHSLLVGGSIKAKNLMSPNPMVISLKEEALEEVAMNLSLISSTSFALMFDEREVGYVNFTSIAKEIEMDTILGAYSHSINTKSCGELEVGGLAVIPILNPESVYDGIEIFEPDGKGGGVWKKEKRGLRPLTQATIDWLKSKKNQNRLIKMAGL